MIIEQDEISSRVENLMSQIKVLFIIDEITSVNAGTESQLSLLIRKLDRERFYPYLLALRPSEWLESDEHYPCDKSSLNMGSVFSISGLLKFNQLRDFIHQNNFHVVQTFFPDSNIIGVIAAYQAGCRIIISTRRNTGFSYSGKVLMATKFANKKVSRFVANSELVAAEISRREGIDKDKFSVIYNGLDEDSFRIGTKEIEEARREMNVEPENKIVGITANHRPVKDIQTFIKAAHEVNKDDPDVRFVIIGSGDEAITAKLKGLVTELGLESAVKFMGSIHKPLAYVKNFDVGLLTSTAEGLSNTLIEYGALSIPAVATDVGGNSEVVLDGKSGYILPAGDYRAIAEKVNKLLDDKELRAQMGKRATQHVWSKFNSILMVKMYQALYVNLYDQVVTGQAR